MAPGGTDTAVTILVASIGAIGTILSAWLYSRHQSGGGAAGRRPSTESGVHHPATSPSLPDPVSGRTVDWADPEFLRLLLERLFSVEKDCQDLKDWRHRITPMIRKIRNVLDWRDDEGENSQ